MRSLRLVFVFELTCTVIFALSGCSSASLMAGNSSGASAVAPTVVAVGVQDNGVAPNRSQSVQFSEAMDPATINVQTFVIADSAGNEVPGKVSYDAAYNVAVFQPTPALQENAGYTVTITTGVANTQSVHMAKAYRYNFTTRANMDTSPVYVASVTPSPNATCVSATSPITITLSEGVDVSTLTSANIVITGPGNAVISAKISYDASAAVATLTPSAPLPSGTISVMVQKVADAAGVAMTPPYSWTFDTTCTSGSAVAYAYVSNSPDGNTSTKYQVTAWAVDTNGHLTPVPGSPFQDSVSSLATNGNRLMASANTQPDINTYTIESDGSLGLASQFDYSSDTGYQQQGSIAGCGSVGLVTFDRTGQSMYADVGNIQCSNNQAVASFTVDQSTGSVNYLSNVNIGYRSSADIAVLGNNAFAYSAFGDCMYGNISAFARGNNGELTAFLPTTTPSWIAAPPGATRGMIYQPALTATDNNSNHLVVLEVPCYSLNGETHLPFQLAIWTADAKGNLSTADTYATMPKTAFSQYVTDMKISPDNTLLAVAGYHGVQVFHYNGSSITSFTDQLTTDDIAQVAWDSHNHLYAITADSFVTTTVTNPNKLYVFTVTDTGASDAPGSPYTIAWPVSVAVHSK